MTTKSTGASASPATRSAKPAWLIVVLCWLIVVLDGYDLIVFGTTLPTLMEDFTDLSATDAGLMGSLVFVGSLIGALVAGDVSDRLGRRNTVLACGLVFTLFTMLIFFAPNKEIFGVFRFIAGLGLGGLVPSANAITAEFVQVRHRSFISTVMMSGIPIGGSIAALLGLVMLPDPGWRTMYLLSAVGLIILAVAWFVMPESPQWLRAHGQEEKARKVAAEWGVLHTLESTGPSPEAAATEEKAPTGADAGPTGLAALFASGWGVASALFGIASIFTLFTWYGLGTWLPKLMQQDDHYSTLMFNPLVFLLSLNIGAVIGSVATAWAGVKFGPLRSGIAAALFAAVGLGFLLTYPDSPLLANAALVLAGIGTHGTQCLVLAAVASHYPAHLRGKALGFASGMGRIGAIVAPILGGFLVTIAVSIDNTQAGTSWNFLMFSASAAFAAAALTVTYLFSRPAKDASSEPVVGH